MIVSAPLIVPLSSEAWSVSWTGTANRVVRAFVSGVLMYGPTTFATADKSITLSLPNPATVEIHENIAGESVAAAGVPLNRRPLIWWRTVPGASVYRIYIDGAVLFVVDNQPSLLHHELRVSSDLRVDAGAWRNLRVAAVSSSNVESLADAVFVFLPGLPFTEPVSVAITGGAGVFDIEVTP